MTSLRHWISQTIVTYNFIALNVIVTWTRILELSLSVYSLPVASLGSQIIRRNQPISPGNHHHRTESPMIIAFIPWSYTSMKNQISEIYLVGHAIFSWLHTTLRSIPILILQFQRENFPLHFQFLGKHFLGDISTCFENESSSPKW